MVITRASQARDTGSIPVARFFISFRSPSSLIYMILRLKQPASGYLPKRSIHDGFVKILDSMISDIVRIIESLRFHFSPL